MKKGLLICLLLVLSLFSMEAMAQRTVSGTVTDPETGEAIPGVTVLVQGTSIGTATDVNGKYTLDVPNDDSILEFSGVGLTTQVVRVAAQSVLDVSLEADSKQLGEVVVVGYGSQEKRDVTGAISTVKGGDIATLATASFDQQLAGRAAGVQVTVGSGILGQAPRIRIRGTNSISSGGSPLIVIDGVPMVTGNNSAVTASNALGDINPSDIESFEVLKDGSATAIYGSRAANGVILITTKRGKAGKPKMTYDTWYGWSATTKRLNVLNAQQFVDINNEKLTNAGQPVRFFVQQNADGSIAETNWQNEVFRIGFQQNHALSLSGGTENTAYFFSLGYTEQQSPIKGNSMKRFSFRSNVDQKINDWLKVGISASFARTTNNGLNVGRNSLSGNVFAAARLYPNVYARDGADPTGYNIDDVVTQAVGRGPNTVSIDNNIPNIAFVIDQNKYITTSNRIIANAYAEIQIPKVSGLKLRTQYGVDLFLTTDFQFLDSRHGDGGGATGGFTYQATNPIVRWNWQNTISYDKVFADKHKLGLVAGVEYQLTKSSQVFSQATVLASNFFGQDNIISGGFATPNIGGGSSQNGFDSYFGRVNYSFADKYLVSASIRSDGISSLPTANRRGTFMGGSLGWRISEETFFQNISFLSFISDFKVRGSLAQVGNVDIGDFPYLPQYGPALYGSQNGLSFNSSGNLGNPNLKWESSTKIDVGVDLGLFESRINLSFDYYENNVNDLVLFAPLGLSLGVPGNGYSKNVGKMRNRGIELQISSRNIDNDKFTWTTDFNISTNQNKVLALDNDQDILDSYNVTRVGQSVGAIYGFQYAGVNPANGNPLYQKSTGVIVQGNIANSTYYTYDPNNPNDFSVASQNSLSATTDRVVLGNTNPTWFGGLSNTFRYKGFDLEIFLRFSGGNKIMNVTRQESLTMDRQNNITEILDRWTTAGQITDVPKVWIANSAFINNTGFSSSRFLEDGDFLRIQNIVLGYTVPQDVVKRMGLSRIRVYAQVQNLFTFTKYKGLDPELNSNGDTNRQFGIDFNSNPIQRVFTFGFNVGF